LSDELNKINIDDIDIPGRPDVVLKVIAMLEDDYCSIAKLEQVILEDPAITAVLLKIANAPLFMTGRSITTVGDAIMAIGISNVVAFVSLAAIANQCLNFSSDQDVMRHSLAVSAAAAMLSEQCKSAPIRREVAVVAGLLHDLGKLVLMIGLPKEYVRVRNRALSDKKSFIRVEEELIGTTHCKIGSTLAGKWMLPDVYNEVILKHHVSEINKTGFSNRDALCYLIRIADKLVLDAGIGRFVSCETGLSVLMECLGIKPSAYDEVSKEIAKAGFMDI
jgi:putative nucleotidyltransferase with HDIG domain